MNLKNRTLFIADNLDIMRGIDSESVDLIYLDPPFNSKREYKAPIGSPAEGATFKDIWTDEDVKEEWRGEIAAQHQDLYVVIKAAGALYDKSMSVYMTAMAVRLFEMKRVLKETGCIYLHCDPTASHYLKIILDSIFNAKNFQSEVIWGYRTQGVSKARWPRKHDVLLHYGGGKKPTFHPQMQRITYEKPFRHTKIDKEGRHYADVYVRDVWDDDPETKALISQSLERTGWPTQKPLALLERIIKASSNEGDFVFDPFCGCATACVAAERLGRRWVGIDISPSAEVITKYRLDEARHNLEGTQTFDPEADVIVLREPPKRTDIQIPKPIEHKPALYGKQDGYCNGCGIHFPYRNMTIDHIRPRARGGADTVDNLQLLCHACNSAKGTGTQDELIAKLRDRGVIE